MQGRITKAKHLRAILNNPEHALDDGTYRHASKSPFWKSWCGQSLAVWVGGAMGHEADHGERDHGLGHLW